MVAAGPKPQDRTPTIKETVVKLAIGYLARLNCLMP